MSDSRRKQIIFVGLVNILILLLGMMKIINERQQDIVINDVPLFNWGGELETDNLFTTEYPNSKYWFSAKTDSLKQGVYSVKVYYETNTDQFHLRCISIADGNKYPAIYADEYNLKKIKSYLTFNLWVNDNLDGLEIRIDCGEMEEVPEDSFLYVEKIEVVRDYRGTVIYRFLKLIGWLLALDGIAIGVIYQDKIKKHFYVLFGLTCIFLISSLSLFTNSQPGGYDIDFHYGRIIGLAEGLSAGIFPVKIQPGWLNGYGYASSVFYGDILLYIPAILYLMKVPLFHAYKLYVFGINLGTVLISYYCFKRLSDDKYIGVTCTALYCLSINRILNVLLRAAVGEYSAFMFLPLVLTGVKELYIVDEKNKSDSGWVLLCLGITGVIQTHIQSFEMVCMLLVVTALILIKRTLQKKILFALGKSVLVTICLNLGFLVPFVDYMREDVNVFSERVPLPYGIQDLGLSIYELFSFGTTAAGQAIPATESLIERIPESLGMPVLIILLLAIAVLIKSSKKAGKGQLLFVTGLAGTVITMATYYFPWNELLTVPYIQNIALSIQFPWRFLSVAMPLLTYMACMVFNKLKETLKKEQIQYFLIGMCLLCAVQGLQCTDLIVRACNGNIKYDGKVLLDKKESLISGEFLLKNTNTSLALEDNTVDGEYAQIDSIERNGIQIKVVCRTEKEAYLEFPLFQYNYYKCVDIETGEEFPVSRGGNNKIRVDLPGNYSGTLRVRFVEPWYWRTSEIISIVGMMAVIASCCKYFILLKYRGKSVMNS